MKHRRLFDFLPIVFLCISLDSSAQEQTIEAQGYSIVVPYDWERVPEEKTIVTARGPLSSDTDKFSENIRIISHPIRKKLAVEDVLVAQKRGLGRFKIIGEGKVVGSTHPMVWLAITPKSPENENDNRVKIDFMTVRGNSVVVVHAMSELDEWKNLMPRFMKIASSLTMPPE